MPDARATVLLISPHETDHSFLRRLFNRSRWLVRCVRSGREAWNCLRRGAASVVVCEKELPDCTWKEVLEEITELEHPPPLIVTSRLADESLWAEVLNLGGYDVLMKPFDPVEVVRVLSLAWRHSHSLRAAPAGA